MENHIYKHDWRHGHHHHKKKTYYALLAMVFFALIALFVVASVYNVIKPRQSTSNGGNAAGTCLEGTPNCNDTPETGGLTVPEVQIIKAASPTASVFRAPYGGYSVQVPAQMEVAAIGHQQISIGEPEQKWSLGVGVEPNVSNMTLAQAFADVMDQMRPGEFAEFGAADMRTYNTSVDGVPARRLSIRNFGDVGETMIVFVNGGFIYVIRGSTGQDWTTPETDVLNFAKTFRFIE